MSLRKESKSFYCLQKSMLQRILASLKYSSVHMPFSKVTDLRNIKTLEDIELKSFLISQEKYL